MAVKDWIPGFLARHKARFDPSDWPMDGSEEWVEFARGWVTMLATRQASEPEADRASLRLAECPPNWRREHIPAMAKVIDEMRRAANADRPGTSREAAAESSKDCPFCYGGGMTPVYHRSPDPARKIPASVGAHCTCPHGRWIRRSLAEKAPELIRRIPDFEAVANGYTDWTIEPPWFAEAAASLNASGVASVADLIRGLAKQLTSTGA